MKRRAVIETNIDCDDLEAYLNGNSDMLDGEYVKVLEEEEIE